MMDSADESEMVSSVVEQARELADLYPHISRVIERLTFPDGMFVDQFTNRSGDPFEFEPMLRTLLHIKIENKSQNEFADYLLNWPYIRDRYDFSPDPDNDGRLRSPRQQTISRTERLRLSMTGKRRLRKVADGIREILVEKDWYRKQLEAPQPEPDELSKHELRQREIQRMMTIARKRIFSPFQSDRASNAKYDDEVYFEMMAVLSAMSCRTRSGSRIYRANSRRWQTPHGDSLLRTCKLFGTSDPQATLTDFGSPMNQRLNQIRRALIEPFDDAVANLFEDTDFGDEVRQPVNVAIDVTPWQFYPSPWLDYDKGIPDPDFPKMVSGKKNSHERAYKFATLTIIGRDVPFILAIAPVKQKSMWESDDAMSMSWGSVVDELLSKAQQHVDINKVLLDRGFDSTEVRDVIDKRGMTYILPKRKYESKDNVYTEQIAHDPIAKTGLITNTVNVAPDGRTHDSHIIYKQSERGEKEGEFAIFTTNAELSDDTTQALNHAAGLAARYDERWRIENQYKRMKEDFLPPCNSKDYRVRLFYFVAAALMYNLWRLTKVLIRRKSDLDPDKHPELTAIELANLLSKWAEKGIG